MTQPVLQTRFRLVDFYALQITFNAFKPSDDFGRQLNFEFDHSVSANLDVFANRFFVIFDIRISNDGKDFDLVIKAIGMFETDNDINNEFLESDFVKVNCPAIAFPYLRSMVSTLMSSSGYPPIFLPAINFAAMGDNKKGDGQ